MSDVSGESGDESAIIAGARKYSVAEIDKMRAALMHRWWNEQTKLGWNSAAEFAERELRTYLLAGIDPDDLIKAEAPRQTVWPSGAVTTEERCSHLNTALT